MKFGACVFLIFLCLFQPYIKGFSVFYVIILLPALFLFSDKLLKLKVDEFFLISAMFLLLFFYAAIGFLKFGIFNQRLFFVFSLNVLMFFVAKIIVEYMFRTESEAYLNKVVSNAILINSITILILNLGFIKNDFFYSFITTNPLVFEYPIPRYPGFTYDAFSYVSTLTAFGFIFVFRNYFHFQCMSSAKMILFSFVILSSIVFSGRTGIILSLFYVVIFFAISVNKLKYLKFLLIISFLLFFSFSISWQSYEWIKDWAFGFIEHIFSGESIKSSDSSVTGVLHSIFLPDDIFFGDFIPFSNVRSDLGFIRVFVSGGIFGLVVTFSLLFLPYLFVAFKYRSVVLFILTISIVFLNFKDVYLVSPYGHFMLLNIYFCYTIRSKLITQVDVR